MPKPEPPYFVLVCSDAELRRQLQICEAFDFRIVHDRKTGGVAVYDRETVLLRTEYFGGDWLVWLHRQYYRHPFRPPSDGSAPPGVA
jgi:hypothetical protein